MKSHSEDADARAIARRRVYARSIQIMQIVQTALSLDSASRNAPHPVVNGRLNTEWVEERSRALAMALADLFEEDTQSALEVDWNDGRIT